MIRKKWRVEVLAAAIHRQIEWQQNMMKIKQEMKIKRMVKRQLFNRARMNSKRSISD